MKYFWSIQIWNIGQHWYAIYRHDKNIYECFDSLGIDEAKKKFLKENFKNHGIKELFYNTSQLQHLETTTCGEFTLYYLFQRLHNQDLDFDTLINDCFSLEPISNEKRVKKFFASIILKQNLSDSEWVLVKLKS